MEPSQRNLSAAAVAVAVFLLVVTAGTCIQKLGWCLYRDHCADVCWSESDGNLSGKCRGFPSRCYCTTCPHRQIRAAPGTIVAARPPSRIG
ncbi:hypothetical protein SORBI_3001G312350 [Sorghum bicolor]|uniref:Knottin scorpion toxin-like domain-containing protein n=1 Tax=Sorghum bicolor TaxID=4558 RepID=A0A1Z5S8H3_SORBI|nr:hypothetical protein SORBI_3001G312350 [Sorghum bicolor]